MVAIPLPPRGRGAKTNASGRYESQTREAFDDGWTEEDAQPAQVQTTLQAERAKTVLTRNDSPDIGFDRSINPYRGCEHGCVYCFARPTHAFQGLSPGLDFETKLFAKPNAAELLEKELSAPGYEPRVMALGTASVMLAVVANRMVGAFGSFAIGVAFALLFHLVNFAITLFSPTIHVMRLHYVEFFGTFFEPGGGAYEPLRHWTPKGAPS